MTDPAIAHYLDHYAEPIVTWFRTNYLFKLDRHYQFVLVIPVFDESLNCLEQVLPDALQQTLVIVIVNSAVDSDPVAIANTQAFLQQFNPSTLPITTISLQQDSDCLIIDCTTDGRQLPKKQGVGLARKIGGDLAIACIQAKIVQSPWIHCTDADVKLPLQYFDITPPASTVAVAIYPFTHEPTHENILFYEISLRYYVLQLAEATSPYAFQTIGSLLKINAHHYAVVRGFPKRKAAEDFYMLNKLAKSGQVLRLTEPLIQLSSRISKRVPFGTGAAMDRLAKQPRFELYHPHIFQHLKTWLMIIPELWVERDRIQEQGLNVWWCHSPLILDALSTLGFLPILPHAYQQCQDLEHFQRYLSVWFDAFRTLKFVHYLRDHGLPNVPITEALLIFRKRSPEQFNHSPSFSHLERMNQKLLLIEQQLPTLTEF